MTGRGSPLGPDGSLYVSQSLGVPAVRQITPDGIAPTRSPAGDGLPTRSATGCRRRRPPCRRRSASRSPRTGASTSPTPAGGRVRRVGRTGSSTPSPGPGGPATRPPSPAATAGRPTRPSWSGRMQSPWARTAASTSARATALGSGESSRTGSSRPSPGPARSASRWTRPAATAARPGRPRSVPNALALGPDGSLYIADGNRVRRIGPDGLIRTVAGTGLAGYAGDGGPATQAQLSNPAAAGGRPRRRALRRRGQPRPPGRPGRDHRDDRRLRRERRSACRRATAGWPARRT